MRALRSPDGTCTPLLRTIEEDEFFREFRPAPSLFTAGRHHSKLLPHTPVVPLELYVCGRDTKRVFSQSDHTTLAHAQMKHARCQSLGGRVRVSYGVERRARGRRCSLARTSAALTPGGTTNNCTFWKGVL